MELWLWGGFLLLVFIMLALDLGVFNRKAHVMGIREALGWTAIWIVMALLFNVAIYFIYTYDFANISEHYHNGERISGTTAACEFLTGYLIEKSLSLDNIFVISMIFTFFAIPPIYQHRVLFWGILGALVLRGIMIIAGAQLIESFEWMIYVFAFLLLITAIKMLTHDSGDVHPENNPLVRLAKRWMPVATQIKDESFFVRMGDRWAMTPLFLALLVIETSDVIFAVDSIPAIFGITHDPFIVFTSNIFALLGLRSLYFALAAMITKFRYLKVGLVVILIYVSLKMIFSALFHDYILEHGWKDMVTFFSLCVIVCVMGASILASIYVPEDETFEQKGPRRLQLAEASSSRLGSRIPSGKKALSPQQIRRKRRRKAERRKV
ncbi:MAG: TerC family protein [Planctomycetia bacterium]|nr:TerC family protein [Planctomycetia bacterium]